MIRILTVMAFCLMVGESSYAQDRNCNTMEVLDRQIQLNPERALILEQIEEFTRNYRPENDNNRAVVTIPVVFHVVYRTATENISDAQLLSQLQVLNDDFRRLNSDANGTWSQAADTEIEFCLATVDPNGNPTTGITRTSTSVTSHGTNDSVKFNSSGGKDAWPAGDYLNFWVCNIGGGILGYAQFPGGAASTDGVVCGYQYTGTNGTATAPFNLGRTATHEVGHWLNLRHIWGDGNCSFDDFVTDTPDSDAANYGCATGHSSCGSTDMVENYMDYSDDACMNLYTLGQKNRMQALFSAGGARASLLNSGGCGNPPAPTCTDGVQNGNETGVDCGGPDCPPCSTGCNDNAVTVTINLDNYPEETSWTVTNSGGSVVGSGGTYGSQPDGSTVVIDLCLPDGCYDFTINDSYGDGICCAYGSGSYTVTNGGSTLASGGSFGSSETTNFCLGGGPAPTCTDGVQNGNETGVDCGGPDCPACPTCSDGVQNGNETGVDCGGPDCPACPTCTDGVQNGNETGVDCGGPDCPPCGGGGTTVISGDFFETGWDGWIDGGSDCYRYNGTRSWEGSRSIRIRDNSGTASSMTKNGYNLTPYSSVEVEFYFYPNSMENGEDFWLRYNDGSGWQTVATWASGSSFSNNSFYVATVVLDAGTYNLSSNASFRFQCDASGNADRIYIDAVTITGVDGGARSRGNTITQLGTPNSLKGKDFGEADFMAYPNPATDKLTIESEDAIGMVRIHTISGVLVSEFDARGQQLLNVDVSAFHSGLYMISVETEDEVMNQKFVKQ